MDQQIRIRPGLICIERTDGFFIGHVDNQIILSDLKLKPLIRRLHEWQSLDEIIHDNSDLPLEAIQNLIEQLHGKNFLEKRVSGPSKKEIVISHMNEIGLALAPILFEEGFDISTLDQSSVHLADVRGAFIRVANHRESFQEILGSQLREIINSGNLKGVAGKVFNDSSSRSLQSSALIEQAKENRNEVIALVTAYPEPELLAFLMENHVAHLFVSTTPFGALIGPFVKPGKSPCFHCIELHRSERDTQWQSIALTLFSDRRAQSPMGQALFAAALAEDALHSIIRGEFAHETVARTWAVYLPSANSDSSWGIREEDHIWSFHRECSCHWGSELSTRAQ